MVLFLNDAALRILDVLAMNLGRPFSIRELNGQMSSKSKKSYYANTHKQVGELKGKQFLTLTRIGHSSSIELNFSSSELTGALAQMELQKASKLFQDHRLTQFRKNLDELFLETPFVGAACIIESAQALALNKIELLFIIRPHTQESNANPLQPLPQAEEQRALLGEKMRSLAAKTSLRIDFLALTAQEFLNELFSPQANPVKALARTEVCVFNPGFYWMLIAAGKAQGRQLFFDETPADARKIERQDVLPAFERHGYQEFGAATMRLPGYSIETAIAAALILEDARLLEAIPIILAKDENKRINYALLEYLARKHGKAGLFGFLLETAIEFSKPLKTNLSALKCLERMRQEYGQNWDMRLQLRKKDISEKMRLYHAD